MIDFIWNNKSWIFEGIGVAVLVWIGALFVRRRHRKAVQRQSSGHSSTNLQAGRDIRL